jgi:hypothetical protein
VDESRVGEGVPLKHLELQALNTTMLIPIGWRVMYLSAPASDKDSPRTPKIALPRRRLQKTTARGVPDSYSIHVVA